MSAPDLHETSAATAPRWVGVPTPDDARWRVAAILLGYVVLGITVLGFNRSPVQVATTVVTAVLLDMLLHRLLRGGPPLFPLSALITGLGLSILVNYAHGLWLAAIPPMFAIASKYLFTFRGRHVYNPALFGVVACLLLGGGLISDSPAYQWGGSYAIGVFIVTLALFLFVLKINRMALVLSFLLFYAISVFARAWLTRWHMPMETWLLGALSSPPLYLFTFFMITDPQTSPPTRRAQVLVALCIVILDFALHLRETLSTLFYAAFVCASLRFLLSHAQAIRADARAWWAQSRGRLGRRLALVGAGVLAWFGIQGLVVADASYLPDFTLTEIGAETAGIESRPGQVLQSVDPRIASVAKWLLSVGDAVATADIDNDGLQDVFLSYPLKDDTSRAGLYRNVAGFRFERLHVPALERWVKEPARHGLPSGALFFDFDNDGDQDLLVLVGYGQTRLLRNRLIEDGAVAFEDVSNEVGLTQYTIAVAGTVADLDRDGRLDLAIGNPISSWLPGYAQPTRFNIFALPAPADAEDRRMFNVMHRTWHSANNGGGMSVLLSRQGRFVTLSDKQLDLVDEHRWTTAIGIADLNGDGWPDLYASNDFGPDQLLINEGDMRFRRVHGQVAGTIGRDTYKGMNVSIADFDNDGRMGVYVSNVHERLQAEGSMLWQLSGDARSVDGWSDRAMERGLLNENRFGWGAAVGDMDLDGRLDILQANGMVDNAYDRNDPGCPDYWYWNDKIALTRPDVHGFSDRWADLRGRCIFPHEKNRVYMNRGQHFVDVADRVGWSAPGNSRGVAMVDLDNDGDLDVIVTHQFAPASIYRNDRRADRPAAWVGLQLRGDGGHCNSDAIGSKVVLDYVEDGASKAQRREVIAVNGFSAQSDRRLLFGLGASSGPVTASVFWCAATTPQKFVLRPGQYHQLTMQKQGEQR
jgi:enediyne biosynthesis protein E4